ncbi:MULTISPECIES: hypothetical protein [Mesorhizobium]|uniref:hypothetical protein n=1 Tax=Mesorhizobium TaxID=68287 RepID=UPI0010A95DE9|nr:MULTISPECIES: hypothetical protein [Mesorhizobium]
MSSAEPMVSGWKMRHHSISLAKEHIRTTLGSLAEWYVLFGNCYACEHIGMIDRWELQRRLGRDTRIKALEVRLVCTKCGNRDHNGFCIAKQKR